MGHLQWQCIPQIFVLVVILNLQSENEPFAAHIYFMMYHLFQHL